MKKLTCLILLIVLSITTIYAQAPQAFNYTGFATNLKGHEIRNRHISVKASIVSGVFDGPILYAETHVVSTSHRGIFSIKVGLGEVIFGTFEQITWSESPIFLKIEIDRVGGSNFKYMGSVELLSVPYALYAGSSDDSDPANELQELVYDPLTNTLSITNGNQVVLGNQDDPTDEIQDLVLDGTTLRITNNPLATPINLENVVVQEGQYYYGDADLDEFGNPYNPVWVPTGVAAPAFFVTAGTDCDDNNATINPGAAEVFDLIDNNCDGQIDEGICIDFDGDGYGDGPTCLGPDCDDNDPSIFPGSVASKECGSAIGACQPGVTTRSCQADGSWSNWGACQGAVGPTPEICDGIDNDCDGVVDNNATCDPVANATTACSGNGCEIISCSPGYCDLNGNYVDGCEYRLDTNPPCNTATDIGAVSGDSGNNVISMQARGEAWFRVYLTEDDSGFSAKYLSATITLNSAPGTDYDLYVYCQSCTSGTAGSSNSSGTDVVNVRWDEETLAGLPSGSDSGGYILIRVQYYNGNSCAEYNLEIIGNTVVSNPTCPDR